MKSNYWIKLYHEILDDPKMGRLPDALWRRTIELFLLAGEMETDDGRLPPSGDMAWRLRLSDAALLADLEALAAIGILRHDVDGWWVANFSKRQGASPAAERMRKYRESRNGGSDGVTPAAVTNRNGRYAPEEEENTEEDTDTESNTRGGGEEGAPKFKPLPPLPQTPKQAADHPELKSVRAVCGVLAGREDYAPVIDGVHLLRARFPEEAELAAYLGRFWVAWSGRKSRNGRRYSRTNFTWLTEWAVNDYIPPVLAEAGAAGGKSFAEVAAELQNNGGG